MPTVPKKTKLVQVRLPDDMRERIERSAKAAFRSTCGEVLYRLALLEEIEQKREASREVRA